jgi:hypothetical protein
MKFELFRTTILPVLYGSITWFLILKKEYGFRVFENEVLRKTFGPKRGLKRKTEKTA